jgi:uncharacterized protein YkwD
MTNTSESTLSASLKKITEQINIQLQKKTLTTTRREVLTYLNHMFCMTRSLTEGILCRDQYHDTDSALMREKDTMSEQEVRSVLLQEHNIRRKNRNLAELSPSKTLDAIAQKYALKLCKVGTISHGLNGSTLSQRYNEGNYDYEL